MKRIFLDASVLVAACASSQGASALILGLCRERELLGYISADVIGEARKNVSLKLGPAGMLRLEYYLTRAKLRMAPSSTVERVALTEWMIHPKDAPILAAALQSPATVILSLDKKHFFRKEVVAFTSPKKIMMPGEFVRKYVRP